MVLGSASAGTATPLGMTSTSAGPCNQPSTVWARYSLGVTIAVADRSVASRSPAIRRTLRPAPRARLERFELRLGEPLAPAALPHGVAHDLHHRGQPRQASAGDGGGVHARGVDRVDAVRGSRRSSERRRRAGEARATIEATGRARARASHRRRHPGSAPRPDGRARGAHHAGRRHAWQAHRCPAGRSPSRSRHACSPHPLLRHRRTRPTPVPRKAGRCPTPPRPLGCSHLHELPHHRGRRVHRFPPRGRPVGSRRHRRRLRRRLHRVHRQRAPPA